MKTYTIGIFFGTILHENLGCDALNVSFIQMSEEISKKWNCHFRYILFWEIPTSSYNMDYLPEELKQYDIQFIKTPFSYFRLFMKGLLKDHWHDYNEFHGAVKSCNFFVDTCGGDSFSDIYGAYTLRRVKMDHYIADKYNIPVIMLPQTIGPFNTPKGKKIGLEIMHNAEKIFIRDKVSYDIAKQYEPEDKLFLTIDMAFHMQYPDYKEESFTKRRIGVSPSALLWTTSYGDYNKYGLREDYKECIRRIIKRLLITDYEIVLLAHVLIGTASNPNEDDYWLCKRLHCEFPETKVAPYFYTPMEAKSYISTLDGLMSSRMHCCIGAYSSGVPVFTLGYSRKFNGLFEETLRYPYGTDLRSDDLSSSIAKLEKFIVDIPKIKSGMPPRLAVLKNEKIKFQNELEKVFKSCIKR